jgi:hypothetical protein
MSDRRVVVEVFGEGKADVGHEPQPQPPRRGVVPILVHALCGNPPAMLVKRYAVPFLQQKGSGKGLWQKVRFARRQAHYNRSDAAVFVVDSEGDLPGRTKDLTQGRDAGPASFPMAVGVAHPCIEAWLLADAEAIRGGLGLGAAPDVPAKPEELPAPRLDRNNNPKTALRKAAGLNSNLAADEMDRIAAAMDDVALVCERCPLGFAPFAGEVERHIRSLFE